MWNDSICVPNPSRMLRRSSSSIAVPSMMSFMCLDLNHPPFEYPKDDVLCCISQIWNMNIVNVTLRSVDIGIIDRPVMMKVISRPIVRNRTVQSAPPTWKSFPVPKIRACHRQVGVRNFDNEERNFNHDVVIPNGYDDSKKPFKSRCIHWK